MTAQFREIITIESEKYGMASEPLDPLIVREFSGHREGFPDGYPTLYPSCTACWRGYIGHWLIDDNHHESSENFLTLFLLILKPSMQIILF